MRERDLVKKALKDFRPKKRLGQTFLVNEAIADRIVEAADISSEDVCLEIGAGLGVLTHRIVPRARITVAVEIDESLCEILEKRITPSDFMLLRSDILQLTLVDLGHRCKTDRFKVISNLPYRVTTPIVFWLVENRRYITSAVLTLQQEVADRLAAEPGSKAYGSITLKVHYYATVSRLHRIGKKNFLPVPEVDSTLIRIDFLPRPRLQLEDEKHLFNLIDKSFQTRRKMLRNCLRGSFGIGKDELSQIEKTSGIDLRRRGETLSLQEFALLSEEIKRIHSR